MARRNGRIPRRAATGSRQNRPLPYRARDAGSTPAAAGRPRLAAVASRGGPARRTRAGSVPDLDPRPHHAWLVEHEAAVTVLRDGIAVLLVRDVRQGDVEGHL